MTGNARLQIGPPLPSVPRLALHSQPATAARSSASRNPASAPRGEATSRLATLDIGQRSNKTSAGFTYVALLIGIALFSTGLGAVAHVSATLLKREHEEELLYIGDQFRKAITSYQRSNRRYPRRLEDLVRDDRAAGVRRHLRKVFVDPVTGNAEWGLVKDADGGITGVHSLSDAPPLKQTGFRPVDAALEGKARYSDWRFVAAPAKTFDPPRNPREMR